LTRARHLLRNDDEWLDEDEPEFPAIDPFIARGLVVEVLGALKSGKEATVYCCRGDPATGTEYLAAKVYRPIVGSRAHPGRGFRDEAVYRAGRRILDRRLQRALEHKSRAGRAVQYASWVGYEWETLRLLHAAGTDVPRPLARSDGAILMEFVGEGGVPAPLLSSVTLPPTEAVPLFDRLIRGVERWLAAGRVHGDLSPYNILYRPGRLTVIDFPQAVDPRENPHARDLLERDLGNVCGYFARHGVAADAARIADALWRRFRRGEL
jgi:RIO kinase 1